MRRRIAILISATLAVLVLVMGLVPGAMPTEEALAVVNGPAYMYSVPFVCGYATDDCTEGVKPGNYATLINIHNVYDYPVTIYWKVTRSLPMPLKRTGFWTMGIPWNASKAIQCDLILSRLGMNCQQSQYATGFVVIESYEPLSVYATYTTHLIGEGAAGISIDTEEIGYWYFEPLI